MKDVKSRVGTWKGSYLAFSVSRIILQTNSALFDIVEPQWVVLFRDQLLLELSKQSRVRRSFPVILVELVQKNWHDDDDDKRNEDHVDCWEAAHDHGQLEVYHRHNEHVTAVLGYVHVLEEIDECPSSVGCVPVDFCAIVECFEIKWVFVVVLDCSDSSQNDRGNETPEDHRSDRPVAVKVAGSISMNLLEFITLIFVYHNFKLSSWLEYKRGDEQVDGKTNAQKQLLLVLSYDVFFFYWFNCWLLNLI